MIEIKLTEKQIKIIYNMVVEDITGLSLKKKYIQIDMDMSKHDRNFTKFKNKKKEFQEIIDNQKELKKIIKKFDRYI